MDIPSTHKIENYGWMKDIPGMKEWVGDRILHNLEAINYQLVNKHWADGVSVDRDDIEDDSLGIYANRFAILGEVAARHKDTLTWQVLLAGFSTLGLDGQYFFDADHIGYDSAGVETSYANFAAGAGSPWFLMDLSRSYMKPLIMQNRQEVRFTALDKDTDPEVFLSRKFMYGVDARYNVGFGFHQLAYAGKVALDATAYNAARVAMGTQRKPDGSTMDVMPTHLIVGPTNESSARAVVGVQYLPGGATNPWFNTAEIVVIPALG